MSFVEDHYEDLLADHYTWMLGGDLESAAAAAARELRDNDLGDHGVAVDLGCGPGPQTFALADLGFSPVIGVDSSDKLLRELMENRRGRPDIRVHNGDLVDALPTLLNGGKAQVITCMGDTLLHLPDRGAVSSLFRRVAQSLAPGGKLVLTYRDLTRELTGTDRFLPVRDTTDRIMTCVLEYPDAEVATVTDLIHLKTDSGWQLHKSSYPKLRLHPMWIRDALEATGMAVVRHTQSSTGLWTTVAEC